MNENEKKESLIRALGVYELRGVARQLGVQSPTTKKREELISLIMEASKNGSSLENSPKRGRPFKKLSVLDTITDRIIPVKGYNDFDSVIRFKQEFYPQLTATGEQLYKFEGIVRRFEDGARVFDIKTNALVYIGTDVEFFDLLETGNKVLLEAKEADEKNTFITLEILEINGVTASMYTPEYVDEGDEIIDDRVIPYGDSGIVIGRRNIHLSQRDAFEDMNFDELYTFCYQNDIEFIVLGVNTSFENQIKFKKLGIENNFSSKYACDNDENVNKILDCILYANNLLAQGKDVMVYVTDIIEVLRCLDLHFGIENNEPHASGTIVVVQKLLSFARSYNNDRSGTLFMSYNKNDEQDEFLVKDILKISRIV